MSPTLIAGWRVIVAVQFVVVVVLADTNTDTNNVYIIGCQGLVRRVDTKCVQPALTTLQLLLRPATLPGLYPAAREHATLITRHPPKTG